MASAASFWAVVVSSSMSSPFLLVLERHSI
jgi:hypothetical protein